MTTKPQGRHARKPFEPSMSRIAWYMGRQKRPNRRKLSPHEALQQLVSRIMLSDIGDADRLKYIGAALVEAKTQAVQALRVFDRVAQTFAEQVKHYRPIVKDLAHLPEEPDETTPADAIFRKLRDTALRKIPKELVAFLLDTPNNHCPCCGRKKKSHEP